MSTADGSSNSIEQPFVFLVVFNNLTGHYSVSSCVSACEADGRDPLKGNYLVDVSRLHLCQSSKAEFGNHHCLEIIIVWKSSLFFPVLEFRMDT